MRFTVLDTPLLYMMAYICYFRVKKKFQDFTSTVKEANEQVYLSSLSQILPKYASLLETVSDVNNLNKRLMMQNNLLIVPSFSVLIVIIISETENWVQLAMKVGIFIPASVYSVRGIVVTSFLANIDFQSKILYKTIFSKIARGQIRNFTTKFRMQQIIEDLSSAKSQLLMREYTGAVTQSDVLENVLRVCQFTMLMMVFSRKFSPDPVI